MENKCAICERILTGQFIANLYCHTCYKLYEDDILSMKPWIRFVKNCERVRRRTVEPIIIHLGDEFDISDSGELVRKRWDERERA